MIKIRKRINLMTLVVFVFLIRPIFSQEDYSIENLRMYINVDDKGDAHVIENITYKFNSQSNGITKSLYLDNNSKLDNLRVYEIYPNKKQLQLELFNDDYNVDFRVYDKSNIETKIYKIEYDLEDFIIKYNGVDEFKFKIFDIDNKESIKKLNISIYFPHSKTEENIKAFQHGYLYKNIKVEKNKVSYNVENFPSNIELELEILLSQNITTYSVQNTNNYISYEKLINKEIEIESKYKNKINKIRKINISSVALLIVECFCLMIFFLNRSIFQKGNLPRDYNSKLPKDCTPAVMMSILKYKKIKSRDFFITILDLIRKGHVLEMGNEINSEYKLVSMNKETKKLKEHEKYLLNWLFSFIGNNNIIYLEDIKKYNQDENFFLEFKRFYNTWKRKVYKECEEYGYLKRKKKNKFLLYLYSCMKISLGILFMYKYSPYLYIGSISLIISSIINNIYLIRFRLTLLGYKEQKKWINFKKFIINFKNPKVLNDYSIEIWETYIVYSVTMNIHKELLYKLRNNKDIKSRTYFNKSIDKKFIQSINTAFRTNELDSFFIFKKSNK